MGNHGKHAGLNGFSLKIIAAAAMLIDHVGAGLYPGEIWLRLVGRLAFPIFAFFICEGFCHTRNVRRYAVRLGVFALVSEVPFNLLHGGRLFDFDAQNIFFTLLIGLLTMYFFDKYKGGAGPGKLLHILIPIAGMCAAELLRTDYGAFGVALIFTLYFCRENRLVAVAGLAALNILFGLLNLANGYPPLQALAGLSAVPLYFYNGEKGPSLKYAFYVFYPAHIAVIMAIKYFV